MSHSAVSHGGVAAPARSVVRGFRRVVRLVVAAALLCAVALPAAAEDFATVDWFQRQVGDGVVWRYYRFDSLFSAKQSISYIEADLGNANVRMEFPYLASSRGLTSSMIPNQFPGAATGVNGTYFDTAAGGGGHETYLRVNNTVVPQIAPSKGAWSWNSAVVRSTPGAVSVIPMPAGGWATDATHPDIMANGPMLNNAGTIPSASFTAIGSHCTGRNPRTAVGVTAGNKLILMTADGRTDSAAGLTCDETAQVMAWLGCTDSVNMDGGGSTTMWVRGEPFNGVVNYPSDNGAYDHLGERACSNAVAVVSPAAPAATRDARINSISFAGTMNKGETQVVTISYKNIGTETWTAADTQLITSRARGRASAFYTAGSWVSDSVPATMTPATVAPNANATFQFTITGPEAASTMVYEEHFQLEKVGVGRFGPANNEARFKVVVFVGGPGGGPSFLVEPREGGQNYFWYTDSGMANTSTNCTATGASGTIGGRYGSTYRSVAGAKNATWAPNFSEAGLYNVYVAWGSGSSRQNNITYHVNHVGGKTTFLIDQSIIANTWIQLGSGPFEFTAGPGGNVQMTNESTDVSGNMFAGPVKFEQVPPASVSDWSLY